MRLRVAEQADVATKLAALVKLLVAKGVISQDEYDEAVRDLVRDDTE